MPGERLAGAGTQAGDDIEHARRQTGFRENLGQAQRGQRRIFRRLDDGRASRRQHGTQAFAHDHQRMVERGRVADDADRGADRVVEIIAFHRNDRVAAGQGEAGVVTEEIRQAADLRACFIHGPAVVQRFQMVHFFEVVFERIRQLVDQAGPDARRQASPFFALECPAGARHGPVDISVAGVCNAGDHLAGGRVQHVDQLAAAGIDLATVDEQAARADT